MRFLIIFYSLALFIFAKEIVSVSILPQKFFVEKIVKDRFEVVAMVPPGSSPATYSVKPKQLQQIKRSILYFSTGVPFEKAWLKRFKSANKDLKIIPLDRYIKKSPISIHHHNHKEHINHSSLDPHIWMAPPLVMLQARVILEEIIKVDPKNKKFYIDNYKKFINELANIDASILKRISNLKQKKFIVYHPSFGYFAKVYNLEQIAIEKEGKEPTAKYLKKIIDFAKKEKIKIVFVEPQFSKKSAKFIAKMIDGKVEVLDPLSYEWDKNIFKVVEAIEKANSY